MTEASEVPLSEDSISAEALFGRVVHVGLPRSEAQFRLLKNHQERAWRGHWKENDAAQRGDFGLVLPGPRSFRLWVRDPDPAPQVLRYRYRPRKQDVVLDSRGTLAADPYVHLFERLTKDEAVTPGQEFALTYCRKMYVKELEIIGAELRHGLPCLTCLEAVHWNGEVSNPLLGWQPQPYNATPRTGSGRYLSLGFMQHIKVPVAPASPEQWLLNVVSIAGENALQCIRGVVGALGLEAALTQELIWSILPAAITSAEPSFACRRCGREQAHAALLERIKGRQAIFTTLASPRPVDLYRVGPSLLCNSCRIKVFGSRYRNPLGSRSLSRALRTYAEFHGEIPSMYWSRRPLLHSVEGTSSRARSLELERQAIEVAAAMPDIWATEFMEQRRQGGSLWWLLLERAGLVQTVRRGRFGVQAIADDGHQCLSLLEWHLCNALTNAGIEHEKEPKYAHWKKIRADFRVGDLLIEIAGLQGREDYDDRLRRKLIFAEAEKLRVLVLTDSDVERLTRARRIAVDDLESLWSVRRLQAAKFPSENQKH